MRGTVLFANAIIRAALRLKWTVKPRMPTIADPHVAQVR